MSDVIKEKLIKLKKIETIEKKINKINSVKKIEDYVHELLIVSGLISPLNIIILIEYFSNHKMIILIYGIFLVTSGIFNMFLGRYLDYDYKNNQYHYIKKPFFLKNRNEKHKILNKLLKEKRKLSSSILNIEDNIDLYFEDLMKIKSEGEIEKIPSNLVQKIINEKRKVSIKDDKNIYRIIDSNIENENTIKNY